MSSKSTRELVHYKRGAVEARYPTYSPNFIEAKFTENVRLDVTGKI